MDPGLRNRPKTHDQQDGPVERVARGRTGHPNAAELAMSGLGLVPFGDAERALDSHLEDPHLEERIEDHIRALLLAIEDGGEPRGLRASSAGG